VAEAVTLKLDFRGKTRPNPKILFGVVIYGVLMGYKDNKTIKILWAG